MPQQMCGYFHAQDFPLSLQVVLPWSTGISYYPDMGFPRILFPDFCFLCLMSKFYIYWFIWFFFLIWEKTLCSPCWDETCQHLASAYWIRGLHVCISKSNFQLLNRTEIGLYLSHCFLNIRFICKIDSSMELENPIL